MEMQPAETLVYQRRSVYDPALRLIHAWNGLSILLLIITAWVADQVEPGALRKLIWEFHIDIGFALIVGIVARLTWGMVGPSQARFSDMWHPQQWLQGLRKLSWHFKSRFGHDVGASLVYLAVYGLLLILAVTGLALAATEYRIGPLSSWLADSVWLKDFFEEPHEIAYDLILLFIAVHAAALIYHERKDKTPLAQSMISGYQYLVKNDDNDEKHS